MAEKNFIDVADHLRVGMRQQRAALAAQEAGREGDLLPDLEKTWSVSEPSGVSGHPVFGPVITVIRKVIKVSFLRWYSRPILQQQNLFNRAAMRRIEELTAANRSLQEEIDELRTRLESS
ncbi:MAG: hypothetical protein K8R59_01150 [Thermoanaerobaculales bacterium]|nr:hypothetical protein [Thermoanaerobaculales bacterium]